MVYLLGNKVGIFAWKWGNMANSEQKMALTAIWKWTRHYGSVHFGIVVVDQYYCECIGIVRNDIFPDALPYKYPYSPLRV